jgi:hypothetical protein
MKQFSPAGVKSIKKGKNKERKTCSHVFRRFLRLNRFYIIFFIKHMTLCSAQEENNRKTKQSLSGHCTANINI